MKEIVKIIQEIESGDLLKVLEFGIKQMIEAEVSHYLNAQRYERTPERRTYRNGFRERKTPLKSGIGSLQIGVPKVRNGNFYPSILQKYSRIDRALLSVISEAYINGVSTRKMENVFRKVNLGTIDKSLVSRCSSHLDKEIDNWRNRALDKHYVYIWVDAIFTKVRTEKGIESNAVLLAIGVKNDGHRDILGLHLGNKESYLNWKTFFQSIKSRGLEKAELWISDDHDGLNKALSECFPGQLRQRCIIHWARNLRDKVSKSDLKWLEPLLSDLIGSKSKESFHTSWERLVDGIKANGKDRLLDWLDETYYEITQYLSFPPQHWNKIKSTNPIERQNEELRRRERCIRIFPDNNSCIRLMGTVLQVISEGWITGRIYLKEPMKKIEEWRSDNMVAKSIENLFSKTCSA